MTRLSVAARILAGLVAGLVTGYLAGSQSGLLPALQTAGGVWLDALRMPIIPLVFALVVTGLGSGSGLDGTTRVARRAIGAFIVFLLASALFGVALGSTMFSSWQVSGLEAVRGAQAKLPTLPPLGDTLRALVPVNPIASAASGAIVPVVIFALLFAIALRHIDRARAVPVIGFFSTIADTLLVIIGWVLLVAPIGVFALAFDVAARSGLAVGALLAWYVLARVIGGVVLAGAFVVLVGLFARTPLPTFLRAALPAQSVAASAQATSPAATYQVEWVYRVRYGGADEWWALFRKYQVPILDEEKRRGFVRDYSIVRPGLHTSEDARWDYRIVITYNGYDGSTHEGEVERALFPDRTTLRREENRRWELTANHWDLPIHTVDPHASPE